MSNGNDRFDVNNKFQMTKKAEPPRADNITDKIKDEDIGDTVNENEKAEKLSRSGHRSRMRKLFISTDMKDVPDHNVLELFLSGIIPQKDVKELAYNLINEFGSLRGVMTASPDELKRVNGVGSSVAYGICLAYRLGERVHKKDDLSVYRITSVEAALKYCNIICENDSSEKIIMTTLNNDSTVISNKIIAEGGDFTNYDFSKTIVKQLIDDNASAALFIYNRPFDDKSVGAFDHYFTIMANELLDKMGVLFVDYIAVSLNGLFSMRNNNKI